MNVIGGIPYRNLRCIAHKKTLTESTQTGRVVPTKFLKIRFIFFRVAWYRTMEQQFPGNPGSIFWDGMAPNWGDRKAARSIPAGFVSRVFLFFWDVWTCARMGTHLPGLARYDHQMRFDFSGWPAAPMRRTAFVDDGIAPQQFVSTFVCHHAGTARNPYRNGETVTVVCVQCYPKPPVGVWPG